MRNDILAHNSKAYEYCNNVLYPKKHKKTKKLMDGVFMAGTSHTIKELPGIFKSIIPDHYKNYTNCYQFDKIYKKNMLYTSMLNQKN